MAYENTTQRYTPSSGNTVTVLNSDGMFIFFYIDTGATLASLTINMPNAPKDSQMVSMCSRRAITTLTLNVGVAGGAFNITAPTTIAAQAAIVFVYYEGIKTCVRHGQTP